MGSGGNLRSMTEWIQNLMGSLGYFGILLLMILENLFPPIPSELILPLAGFTAARGDMNLFMVIAMGTLGSVIGTMPLYFLGYYFSEEKLTAWADQYGKWLALNGKDIRRANEWFDRHGKGVVLFGRMVPGIRSLLSLPAGMNRMPLPTFIIFSAIGSALWSAVLTLAGYLLGEHYEKVDQYMAPLSKIVLGLLVVAAIVWFVKRKKAQSAEK